MESVTLNTASLVCQVASTLLTLKVLAKFLGFLESIPYKCQTQNISKTLLAAQLRNREKVKEPDYNESKI